MQYSHSKGTLLIICLKCVLVKYSTSPQTSNCALFFPGWLGWDRDSLCADRVTNASSPMGTMVKTATILFRPLLVNNWVFSVEHLRLWPSATSPAAWLFADNRGYVFCLVDGWLRYCLRKQIQNVGLILWTGHFADASSKYRTKVHDQTAD